MINIEESVKKNYQTLAEIREIDVENWSDEAKEEMEKEVDEVIKLALATKLKLQRASLNQFLDTLETAKNVEVSTLEDTIKYMETLSSNMQSLLLKKAG